MYFSKHVGVHSGLLHQVAHNAFERGVGPAHVVDHVLELREELLNLGPLPAHVVYQQGVLDLRVLQLGVELRLVRCQAGEEVGG